jgi:hypothetical protein
VTDRLGRLLLVTLEAARVDADVPVLGVVSQFQTETLPPRARSASTTRLSPRIDTTLGPVRMTPFRFFRKPR